MTEEAVSYGTQNLIYTGRRFSRDKLVYRYEYEDNSDEIRVYAKPLKTGVKVGSIIELTWANEERTSYWAGGANAPALVGFYAMSPDSLLHWEAADIADSQRDATRARATRLANEKGGAIEALIEPLHAEFRKLNHTQKTALLSYVSTRLLS